jgi:hypothetical protein
MTLTRSVGASGIALFPKINGAEQPGGNNRNSTPVRRMAPLFRWLVPAISAAHPPQKPSSPEASARGRAQSPAFHRNLIVGKPEKALRPRVTKTNRSRS